MNNPVSSSFVAFHVASATLITPGDTPVTLFTLPSNDRLVRVPTHLELYIANTDTAYTLGSDNNNQGASYQKDYTPSTINYADAFSGGLLLYVVNNFGQILFATPMKGLFDSLSVQKRLVLANTNGATFKSGDVSFRLKLGTGLSAGDGDLYGRLHFNEYALYA